MKSLLTLLLAAFAALTITSCSDSTESSSDWVPSDTATFRRTVIIYAAAQNSLGGVNIQQSLILQDSAEIVNGAVHMNKYDNIILFIDDAQKPRIYRVCKPTSGKSITLLKQYESELNSGAPSTLQEVLSFTKENYKSSSYGLVMWSHGDSWLPSPNTSTVAQRAFGIDNQGHGYSNYNTSGTVGTEMDISDMATAIKGSGIDLDFIYFDACLMQSIEVDYELKDVTKYIIASPHATSGYGAYYTDMIREGLFCYPTNDDNIAKMAETQYKDVDTMNEYDGWGVTISVVKTSELDNLATVTKRLITEAISNKKSVDVKEIQPNAIYLATYFYRPEAFDMGSAMKHLLSETSYAEWRKQLDKTVIAKYTTDDVFVHYTQGSKPNSAVIEQFPSYITYERESEYYYYYIHVDKSSYCGVSMFIPRQKYTDDYETGSSWNPTNWIYGDLNKAFKKTAWYEAAGWSSTGW